MIFLFYIASKKPFFDSLFEVCDYDRQYYEFVIDFKKLDQKLANLEQSEFGEIFKETFLNFQYEAGLIIQSLCLVLHYNLLF